jgi:hypothetical protein
VAVMFLLPCGSSSASELGSRYRERGARADPWRSP